MRICSLALIKHRKVSVIRPWECHPGRARYVTKSRMGEWQSRMESGDNQRYEEHGRLLTLADVVWQFISTLFLINFPDLKCASQLCMVWQTSKKDLVWTFKSTVHHREWRLVVRRKFKDFYSFSACKINFAELERSKNWCSNSGWMQRFNPSQSPFTTVQFYRPRLTA